MPDRLYSSLLDYSNVFIRSTKQTEMGEKDEGDTWNQASLAVCLLSINQGSKSNEAAKQRVYPHPLFTLPARVVAASRNYPARPLASDIWASKVPSNRFERKLLELG